MLNIKPAVTSLDFSSNVINIFLALNVTIIDIIVNIIPNLGTVHNNIENIPNIKLAIHIVS